MSVNNIPFVRASSITTGGTAQKLVPSGIEPTNGVTSVIIKARAGNTAALYLGNASTGGGTNGSLLSATTGFELSAGSSVAADMNTLGNFWVFGATTGDKYDILEI